MPDHTRIDEGQLDAALRRPERLTPAELRWYLTSGALLVLAAAGLWTVAAPTRAVDPLTIATCVVLMAVACRVEFDIPGGLTVPLQAVFVPMLLLLPPAVVVPAVVVALALGQLPDVLRGRLPASRLLICPGNAWFAFAPALVFAASGDPVSVADGALLLPLALAVQLTGDFGISALREHRISGTPLRGQLSDGAWVYLVDLLLTPLGLMAALAAVDGPLWLALLVGPLAILWFFAGERRKRLEQLQELNRAYRGTALVLGDVVEADDAYTGMHCRGVVALSLDVGAAMHLDGRRMRNLEFGALLHDVGKVAVPKDIVNKPGPLDDEEWALMHEHTIEGQRMLERIGGFMIEVGAIVRASHERWDGDGYPDGLAREAIPLEARIVAVCDAYHAMTTTRSYREALSAEAAVAELRLCAGSQFDPVIVDAALSALTSADSGWAASLSEGEAYAAVSRPTSASLARR